MNKKEIVENIKKLIFSENKEEKLAQAKLEDGTIVMSEGEEFEIGSELFVVSEDGSKELAPDGEHTLEDGSVVMVMEGKISEIIEKEEDKENGEESESDVEVEVELEEDKKEEVEVELEEDKKEEEMEEEKEDLKPMIEALKEELKDMKEKMAQKEEMSTEKFSKIEDLNEAMKEVLKFIAESPAGEKLEVKKQGFYSKISQDNLSKKERNQQEIAKFFAERNKK